MLLISKHDLQLCKLSQQSRETLRQVLLEIRFNVRLRLLEVVAKCHPICSAQLGSEAVTMTMPVPVTPIPPPHGRENTGTASHQACTRL